MKKRKKAKEAKMNQNMLVQAVDLQKAYNVQSAINAASSSPM